MPSNRIGRINEEIQRELADQLRRLKDPRVSQVGMVSITRVDTTSDLRYARVYVSTLDKTQEKDVLKGLKSAAGFLRRELGRSLQLRYTPELVFELDHSIEYGAHISRLIEELDTGREEEHGPDGEGVRGLAPGARRLSAYKPPPPGRGHHRLRCRPLLCAPPRGQAGLLHN